jgi:hypothetical protein
MMLVLRLLVKHRVGGKRDVQAAPTTKGMQNHVRVLKRRKVCSAKRSVKTITATIAAGREGEYGYQLPPAYLAMSSSGFGVESDPIRGLERPETNRINTN